MRSEVRNKAPSGRLALGRNWQGFVSEVREDHVDLAVTALRDMLGPVGLEGSRFLDVGRGSGVSSLAAWRLGAHVHSFDYDAASVADTERLRDEFSDGPNWHVERGDVLGPTFTGPLDRYEIVYSWGVLQHTGDLWRACEVTAELVADGGRLVIALYNDQGRVSRAWGWLKREYVTRHWSRPLVMSLIWVITWGPAVLRDVQHRRNPAARWREYKSQRGMSPRHDLVDWAGGSPFEVASFNEVVEFFESSGFALVVGRSVERGRGCNEFVLVRTSPDSS